MRQTERVQRSNETRKRCDGIVSIAGIKPDRLPSGCLSFKLRFLTTFTNFCIKLLNYLSPASKLSFTKFSPILLYSFCLMRHVCVGVFVFRIVVLVIPDIALKVWENNFVLLLILFFIISSSLYRSMKLSSITIMQKR